MPAPPCLPLAACLLLVCLGPGLRAAEPAAAATDDGKIELPKFEVRANAICSYGIGVTAVWNKQTQNLTHLYIDTVSAGSVAESLGLKPGDEILSLNGRKLTDLHGGAKHTGELFGLLVNQPVGRTIDIEVAVRVVRKIVLTATP